MLSNRLILCHACLLLPSIFPSIRVFSSKSTLRIKWPKYWSVFSISPSSEYSGLVSLRIDWFDLLAVQGTLKSLLQHHNLKASVLIYIYIYIYIYINIHIYTYICIHTYTHICMYFFFSLSLSLIYCEIICSKWTLNTKGNGCSKTESSKEISQESRKVE